MQAFGGSTPIASPPARAYVSIEKTCLLIPALFASLCVMPLAPVPILPGGPGLNTRPALGGIFRVRLPSPARPDFRVRIAPLRLAAKEVAQGVAHAARSSAEPLLLASPDPGVVEGSSGKIRLGGCRPDKRLRL